MILKLIWKEVRENLWKAAILAIVAVAAVLFVRHRDGYSAAQDCAPWLIIAGCVATVWIAASTAASERSGGSLDVLLALPVRPVVLFAIKVSVGLATLLLPFVVALVTIHFEFREPFNQNSLDTCLSAIAVPVPLYFAILAIAARARQESRAAMIGVLTLLGSVAWGLIVVLIADPATPWYLVVPNPLFVLFDRPNPDVTEMIPVQIIITVFWIFLAAARFLRIATNTGTGSEERQIPVTRTLILPLEYPPLLWKEVREQISVLAIAFWSAIGVAVIAGMLTYGNGRQGTFFEAFGVMLQAMLVAGAVIPLLISIVLGVGAFSGDLEEHLLHFWRGQPISPNRWFWTKYVVSAVGIFILLVLPLSVAAGGSSLFDLTGDRTHLREQAWTIFIAVLITLPFSHALSIFFASIIRRTMYATILAIIVLIAVAFVPIFTRTGQPLSFTHLPYYNLAEILSDRDEPTSVILMLFAISLILATLLLTASRHLLTRNWRLA